MLYCVIEISGQRFVFLCTKLNTKGFISAAIDIQYLHALILKLDAKADFLKHC